jgi:hypothetical protein
MKPADVSHPISRQMSGFEARRSFASISSASSRRKVSSKSLLWIASSFYVFQGQTGWFINKLIVSWAKMREVRCRNHDVQV